MISKPLFYRFFQITTLFFILLSKPAYSDNNDISILHINDTNGNIEPIHTSIVDHNMTANKDEDQDEDTKKTVESGGFARIYNFVSNQRKKNPFTLFVSSGDIIAPMPISAKNKGQIDIKLLNMSGLDVWSPGNFDFMYGFKELEKRVSEANFKVISSNIFLKKTNKEWLQPYTIIEKNNKKIAFLGVTSLRYLNNFPADVRENILVKSPLETVTKISRELKGKVDLIVLIAQTTIEEKSEILGRTDVDLVVGGIELYKEAEISHFRTQSGKVSSITKGMTQSVGQVDVSWEDKTPKFDNVKENYLGSELYSNEKIKEEKSKIQSLIKEYENSYSYDKIASFDNNISKQESRKFVVGLMRNLTSSDLAVFKKSFFLRNTKLSEKITSQDIYTFIHLPFKAALVKINGTDLKAFLTSKNDDSYIFSGIKKNKVNGLNIIDNETYTLCTDEYFYNTDSLLKDRGKATFTNENVNDMVNNFFLKNKNKTFSANQFDNDTFWKLKFNVDVDPQILNVNIPKEKNFNYLPWRSDQSSVRWGGALNLNLKKNWDLNEFENTLYSEFRQQQIGTDPIKVVTDRIRFDSVFKRDLMPEILFGYSELRVSSLFTNPDPKKSALLLGQLIAGIGQNLPLGIKIKEGLEVRKNFFSGSLPWQFGPSLGIQINQPIWFLQESLDTRVFVPFIFNNFVIEIENKLTLPITDKFKVFYKFNFYNEDTDFKYLATSHNVGINISLDNALLF